MPYYLIIFLFLSSCINVDITRLMKDRYCPQAFILQGAERDDTVELGQLDFSCNPRWSGAVSSPDFIFDSVDLDVGIWHRLRDSAESATKTRVAVWVLSESGKRIGTPQILELTAARAWSKRTLRISLKPQASLGRFADVRILIGLAPPPPPPSPKLDKQGKASYNEATE